MIVKVLGCLRDPEQATETRKLRDENPVIRTYGPGTELTLSEISDFKACR